ncbi:colicin E5-related ribonuclease [Photorhabdus australis]|uniref:colicin E5-related ribonuclease n=1 Tax=Photorhabdus australis TaxID=286156 RepID=UPI0009DFFAFF|nr:colicin E5-related ribonuclease [Photorhabdus australis]
MDDKIRDQISSRGWTEKDIKDVVAKGPTGKSTDNRRPNKTPDKLGRNDTATVYGTPPNGYIVVNDRTGEVTQIADKTDSGWNADSRIKWSK